MKKFFAMIIGSILILFGVNVFAQDNTFPSSGKVGIGTTTPLYHLDILTPQIGGPENLLRLRVSDSPNDYLLFRNATGINNAYIPSIKGYFASDNRPAIFLGGEISSANDNGSWPVVVFDARAGNAFVNARNLFSWKNYTTDLMVLSPTGNLGIGTPTPTHKLEVNGTIRAKEVKLEASVWPDYVFNPGYELMGLDELSEFLKENRHLPEVPSEKEILEKGLNLGEMNSLLLKKIEELTLYLLLQQKELEKLNQKIEGLYLQAP